MELTLTFSNPAHNAKIPIDYQYFLSSWMYKIIHEGDEGYGDFLHNRGYKVPSNGRIDSTISDTTIIAELKGSKVFKLFNFSNLLLPKLKIIKEENLILVQSDSFKLKVRFKIDAALEHFIKGLFTGQSLTLKNGFDSMCSFDISSVESKQVNLDKEKVIIKLLSPIVISKRRTDSSEEYLSPTHEDYERLFFKNLLDKYLASGGQLNPQWQDATHQFRLLDPDAVRSKLITISKPHQRPIKVKGYLCKFELHAPVEILETGLLAGFGKDNAMGFGFGEVENLNYKSSNEIEFTK